MTEVYFHYSNSKDVLVDRGGTCVNSHTRARDYTQLVIRTLILAPGPDDGRD